MEIYQRKTGVRCDSGLYVSVYVHPPTHTPYHVHEEDIHDKLHGPTINEFIMLIWPPYWFTTHEGPDSESIDISGKISID